MSWQLSIGVERVKCTHLDFSYRFFCCTSYFNLRINPSSIKRIIDDFCQGMGGHGQVVQAQSLFVVF